MLEYELSVNIKVENEKVMDNILVTVESINSDVVNPCSIELVNVDILKLSEETFSCKKDNVVKQYELDSWLSPIVVKMDSIF